MQLDHMIVPVNDLDESVEFYTKIVGLAYEGRREPFAVVRVTPDLTLQLAPWGTRGGQHLAFSLEPHEFDAAFDRVKRSGLPYGDRFDTVGNMKGPGIADGARGDGKAVYFDDPDKHLIEIRSYDP